MPETLDTITAIAAYLGIPLGILVIVFEIIVLRARRNRGISPQLTKSLQTALDEIPFITYLHSEEINQKIQASLNENPSLSAGILFNDPEPPLEGEDVIVADFLEIAELGSDETDCQDFQDEIPLSTNTKPAKQPQAVYSIPQSPTPDFLIPPSRPEKSQEWLIGFSSEFWKAINKLDASLRGRILSSLSDLSLRPDQPKGDTIKPLTGDLKGFWRYRIGDHRMVYKPDPKRHTVTLLTFASRGEIYE